MPLATYVGILLNLILPRTRELLGQTAPGIVEAPDV